MKQWLEEIRTVRIIPLAAGVFVCYVAQFIGVLLRSFMGFFVGSHVDIINHPELAATPSHPVFILLVQSIVTLVGIAVAGYVTAMLAGEREKMHVVVMGALFTLFSFWDTFALRNQQAVADEMWANWLVVILTIPAAAFGLIQYLKGMSKPDGLPSRPAAEGPPAAR